MGPEIRTEKLDLAPCLLRRQHNPVEARPILEERGDHEGGDLVKVFHHYCCGLLAIEESHWKSAEEKLRAAIEATAPYAHNVLVKGMLSDLNAHLAIALANLGHAEEARQLFHAAEPLLKARREVELIDRCRRSLAVS